MISPEAFERTHKRRATDVIRVSLERSGVIGFININESMSLLEARTLISENVENAPAEFQFVLDDGAPVSARQESTQKISYFYPCVKIRECSRGNKHAMSTPSPSMQIDEATASATTAESSYGYGVSGTAEKISVHKVSGEEFSVWISEDYTFQQLRRDASRYWNLPSAQVALTDADGCLWPEQAKILSMMSMDELRRKKVMLECRGGSSGGGRSALTARPKQLARTQSASFSKGSSFRQSLMKSESSGSSLGRSGLSSDGSSPTATMNPVEELWLVFTFYCVNGDSLELECIKAHQFNKLLRDARLFGGNLTPAMADIIYTSETKGKPHASGKMNYDEFLNALMKISATKHKQSSKQVPRESSEEELLFQKVVVDSILPLASRWPRHVWEVHTRQLRKPEIVSFISKFLEPLLEIFMFYAKSHLVNPARGVKELYMSYADYQRFFNDFAFANLQLSSVDAAQVFLASCSSSPFHEALFTPSDSTGDFAAPSDLTIDPNSVGSSSGSAASIQRVLENVEGVVTYAFPEHQIGRMCMGVSAFLDSLGRTGLTAFANLKTIKTIHCVKAIFHHLSRGLTRSRVLEILNNHSSTSIHATKFYSGSVAFNNKFLDMWRYEGSPDYLSGSIYTSDATTKENFISSTNSGLASSGTLCGSVVSGAGGGGGGPGSPLHSPARRLMTTTSMFEDRMLPSGAGKGREALDRLVRNAFLRNAVEAVNENMQANSSARSTNRRSSSDGQFAGSASTESENEQSVSAVKRGSHRCDTEEATCPTRLSEAVGAQRDANEVDSAATLKTREPRKHVHDAVTLVGDDVRHLDISGEVCDGAPSGGTAVSSTSRPPGSLPPGSPHAQHARPPLFHSPTAAGAIMAPPLRREDERVLYESILLKGGVFKKYGQWGNPHRRYVWCSKDFDAVFWRPLNRKNNLSKEGIAVAGIIAVLPGNSTRTRYAFMKHLSEGKVPMLFVCFR